MHPLILDGVTYAFRLAAIHPDRALIAVAAHQAGGDTASTVFTVRPTQWFYDQAEDGFIENPFILDGSWPPPPPALIGEARLALGRE